MTMASVYIGLGTNLGSRYKNIQEAKSLLTNSGKIKILKQSSIAETDPVDFPDQPKFLNQIILTESDLTPIELLNLLKNIEKKMGRIQPFSKGPRIIDLDILHYNNTILETDTLKIPHPEIKNREFILRHLLEISPDLADPITGHKYDKIYGESDFNNSSVEKIEK